MPALFKSSSATLLRRIPLIITLILFLAACSGGPHNEQLLRLADRINDNPEATLDSLAKFNRDNLSQADRHFFDFLTVKARDKAYITHTSDSLILDVIKYYKGHPYSNLYAEALYYGGRVYSDLGDYPSALDYFRQSLNLLGDSEKDLQIKYRVLSQTGRLLSTLRLYEEAGKYVKEALQIEKEWNDTLKMIDELILLSEINYHSNNFKYAEELLTETLKLSESKPQYNAEARMFLAAIKAKRGDLDNAKLLIKNISEKVDPITRNTALAYSADIYLKAGELDSAYKYANEILLSEDKSQKGFAYYILFSPYLKNYIPSDSLNSYINRYRRIMEGQFNENSNYQAIIQESYYNYVLQEKKRIEAEKSKNNLFYGLLISIIVILLMSFLVIILKFKRTKDRYQLKETLENVNRLRNFIQGIIPEDNQSEKFEVALENKTTISGLREALRTGLISLYESRKNNGEISPIITNSTSYIKLQELIKSSKVLNDEAQLWNELEEIVLESSPEFKTRLKLLLGGKLSLQDYHTCILIKCGIPPKNMATLLRRSLNTISTRRETLGYKVFGKKIDNKVIDGIIRLL